MKPDWDKLMAEFKDSKTALVADVDCTAAGKSICDGVGVRGYPTIKHGDPNNLEDYKGGRSYDQLKEFADKNLGPTCGPNNLDLCDDEKKEEINKFQAMSDTDLETFIKEKEAEIVKAEEEMKTIVEGLQKQYETANAKKDKTVESIKNSGLGVAKAVKGAGKAKKEL
jgi:hypothetical protein